MECPAIPFTALRRFMGAITIRLGSERAGVVSGVVNSSDITKFVFEQNYNGRQPANRNKNRVVLYISRI
jgi:hypothetical protein